MRYLGVLAAATLILAISAPLWAISVEGDPFEADSWAQRFSEGTNETDFVMNKPPDTVAYFDTLQMKLVDLSYDKYGDLFEQTASLNFSGSSAGWKGTYYDGGRILVLAGPAVQAPPNKSILWDLTFTAPQQDKVWDGTKWVDPSGYYSDPLLFYFQAYYNGQIRQNQNCLWTGTGWQFSNGAWDQRTPIPEPLTMAGLGLGIMGLVGYVRRRRG